MKRPFLLVWLLLLAGLPAAAQSIGPAGIEGRVTDPRKVPVREARITITSEAHEISYRATTGSHGEYQVLGLPPGRYTVEVVVPAFKVALYKHVHVRAGVITRLDVVLRVASAQGTT